jgi:hypothetical protein
LTRGASLKTQSEIRERLVALIALHTGVSAKSVARESSIWDNFQPSTTRGEHPTVTSFIDGVQSEFKVYLTEEEWEDPTPESLAHDVRAKLENPAASLADWTHDRKSTLSGFITMFVVTNVLIVGVGVASVVGTWEQRASVMVGLLLLVNLMTLNLYRAEKRKQPLARLGTR